MCFIIIWIVPWGDALNVCSIQDSIINSEELSSFFVAAEGRSANFIVFAIEINAVTSLIFSPFLKKRLRPYLWTYLLSQFYCLELYTWEILLFILIVDIKIHKNILLP